MSVPSQRLADRYLTEEHVAQGGMGNVYRARDERLHRSVAVKVLRKSLAEDPRFVERFRREARAVAGLEHPWIATIFDYGEEASAHFIVMEFAQGKNLSQIVAEDGRVDAERAAVISTRVAEALGHAHSRGIVHRDVKAANVIVGSEDSVKVTDFGIARAAGASLTTEGTMLGTPQYMSPEQVSGEEVGPPSDVYSLGIVLYEMLTGSPPFQAGGSAIATAVRHAHQDVPPPSDAVKEVPRELDRIVTTATARDPVQRFPDGSAMAQALATSLPGTPTSLPAAAIFPGTEEAATGGATGESTPTAPLAAGGASPTGDASPKPSADGSGGEASGTIPPQRRTGLSRRSRGVMAIVALLALGAVGAGVMGRDASEGRDPERATVEPQAPAQDPGGEDSADGTIGGTEQTSGDANTEGTTRREGTEGAADDGGNTGGGVGRGDTSEEATQETQDGGQNTGQTDGGTGQEDTTQDETDQGETGEDADDSPMDPPPPPEETP